MTDAYNIVLWDLRRTRGALTHAIESMEAVAMANFGERFVAHARVAAAKRKMDDAQAAFEAAEAEWLKACVERDRVENVDNGE